MVCTIHIKEGSYLQRRGKSELFASIRKLFAEILGFRAFLHCLISHYPRVNSHWLRNSLIRLSMLVLRGKKCP